MVNVEGGAKETNKMLNMFLRGGGSSLYAHDVISLCMDDRKWTLYHDMSVQQTEGHSNYFSIFTFSNIDDLLFLCGSIYNTT